jgi:aryl-alcohol dehydrogenase-like predicted oxidoreductase
METTFSHTILGKTGLKVHRLALAASYRPGKEAIYKAIDSGINLFFGFGIDTQMMAVMKDILQKDREKYVVATGAYNYIFARQGLTKTLEKRLRQLKTDYIDIFMFLGVMKEKQFPEPLQEELAKLKETGKIRFTGISCHDRKFLGSLADKNAIDVLMLRYNAAHRGAEQDIFPYISKHNPGIMSYTATRWRFLINKPKNYPPDGRIPTPGECYRFALSNPNVHVCLTAPSNIKQLEENIKAINEGPLNEEDMRFIKQFGDVVHHTKKWFM